MIRSLMESMPLEVWFRTVLDNGRDVNVLFLIRIRPREILLTELLVLSASGEDIEL